MRIFSRFDFERPPDVSVGGEVRAPGDYRTTGEAHLRDAVYLAGGLTPDAALDSAQLFRTQADGTLRILSIDLGEALAGNPVDNIVIQARDRLLIHRKLESIDAPTVNVTGRGCKTWPLSSDRQHAGRRFDQSCRRTQEKRFCRHCRPHSIPDEQHLQPSACR